MSLVNRWTWRPVKKSSVSLGDTLWHTDVGFVGRDVSLVRANAASASAKIEWSFVFQGRPEHAE